ncbi:phage exclusion protein Lit family protein [Dongia soli]|uniref:Phage exclusion protein Lit family protein n=1 Tax=Dongia soli TaxID=600628 RepID=A0ABU5EHC7_9PROT|nr:phage exclusion protein Lit family protein [Dongia soli]MDY0885424.1 phage exclusion protein Lit family protein [Dongia soli]
MKPFFSFAARVPFNIAPERGTELAAEIFGSGRWQLVPSEMAANFYAVPSDKAIYLSYAGLASLWCIAYAAFNVADVASRLQRAPKSSGQTEINIAQEYALRKIPAHIAYSKALVRQDQDWPDDLPQPQASSDLDTPEGRVNNAFYGALSWILLHEIAHVFHGGEKLLPASLLVRQEYRADDFATRWILDNAGHGLYREFRVLVVVISLTWLFVHEQTVGVGTDHPPAILRFREASTLFQTGDRSVGLENAAYVLKALLDPFTPAPPHDTAKDAFQWISGRLEDIFKVP